MKNPSPGLIQHIVEELDLRTDAVKDFLLIALENAALFDKKQEDYGPRNMAAFGAFGVVVRANDKFERIKHMFNNRRSHAVNESIEDSYRDISNYMIIALMLENGKWPGYVSPNEPPKRVRKKKATTSSVGGPEFPPPTPKSNEPF